MNETVIAAIITGTSGLIGGLAVGYREELKSMFGRSSRRVEGTWAGRGIDIVIPGVLDYEHPLTYDITGHFTQTGRKVSARLTIISDRTSTVEFLGRLKGEYIVGEYKNLDPDTLDWGYGFGELLGTGRDIVAFLLGVRMREHGVVIAKVQLKRQ